MSLRPFKLPDDITTLLELLPPSFQYPENPEWSIEADEMEGMVDSMRGMLRLWPLLRGLQFVVPTLRDMMRGFVWEEDGKPVGVTNVLRQGTTDRWLIGNVSVLPEYRRRGIARKLVEASMDLAKGRGAKSVVLDVVDGNVPAYTLYERLGFTHYDTHSELSYETDTLPTLGDAPDGYRIVEAARGDWKPRFVLAQRVTPEAVQAFMPVEEGQYRPPMVMRTFAPLFMRAAGMRTVHYHIWGGDTMVGYGRVGGRTRAGGVNDMSLTLDPSHAGAAPYVMRFLLHQLWAFSPGRRIETSVHQWDGGVQTAALGLGFRKKYDFCSMGIVYAP